MVESEEQVETKKVGINKVKFRLLELWPPSVKAGFENETQISDFEILAKVGEGSFGVVFKAKYKKTGCIYAIKSIDKKNKTNQEGRSYFKREIEIMYKIRHPNIVRLYTHFEDDHYCYFVMEYISKGNLYSLLEKQRKKCFDAKLVAHYIRDLMSAVYYLHQMDPPIIHRDIKLENVLLHEDGTIKLTDFGWSNYICDDEVRDTFCGTPVYLPPEMIKRKEHDHNVDIWCIGVLIFELISGKLPWDTTNKATLEESIMKVNINWPSDMSPNVKDVIGKILKFKPSDRLQIENIFKHPYFTGHITNMQDYLIKPNANEEHEVFVITKMVVTDNTHKQIKSGQVHSSQSQKVKNETEFIEENKKLHLQLEAEKQERLILLEKIDHLEKKLLEKEKEIAELKK